MGLRISNPTRLDAFEKYILLAIFCVFLYRMLQAFLSSGALINLLFLLDQMLIVIFILFRRGTGAITLRPSEWFAGFAGTFLPLLMSPVTVGSAIVPPSIAALVMLAGIALHLAAKLTLRRSFGVVAANRGVKVSGPYRFVRHPMYAGYVLTHIGWLLSGPNLQNLAVIGITWSLFVWRIYAEERVLGIDPQYLDFSSHTKSRLVPGIF